MSKVVLNNPAPDFTLNDLHGNPVRLSEFLTADKKVVLILNRGFF